MLSRRKGCQFLTLLTVLYPQSDRFVLLDLHFLTFHLELFRTQPKKKIVWNGAKSILLFRTAIFWQYTVSYPRAYDSHVLERELFIGTRFSNLMKRPPRGQTLEEDEIKELKLKFKKITFSIMKMIVLLFLNKILLEIRVAKYCFTALVNRTLLNQCRLHKTKKHTLFLTAILAVYFLFPRVRIIRTFSPDETAS